MRPQLVDEFIKRTEEGMHDMETLTLESVQLCHYIIGLEAIVVTQTKAIEDAQAAVKKIQSMMKPLGAK